MIMCQENCDVKIYLKYVMVIKKQFIDVPVKDNFLKSEHTHMLINIRKLHMTFRLYPNAK